MLLKLDPLTQHKWIVLSGWMFLHSEGAGQMSHTQVYDKWWAFNL